MEQYKTKLNAQIFSTPVNATVCALICGKSVACQVAYWKPTNTSCNFCEYGSVTMVTRSNLTSDYVAVKRTDPSISIDKQTCPTYNFTLKTCEPGWKFFFRQKAFYCLKLLNLTAFANFNRSNAIALCGSYNSMLSGLESEAERLYVTDAAWNLRNKTRTGEKNLDWWGVWIDGERYPSCYNNTSQNCSSMEGFSFKDSTLQLKTGYKWYNGAPGSTSDSGNNCIQLIIRPETAANETGLVLGSGCEDYTMLWKKLVLCGKKAA